MTKRGTLDDLNDFVFIMDTEIKLCKNCKFFKETAFMGKCENPIFPKQFDVVTGEYYSNLCSHLRSKHQINGYSYGLCGPEARHFEKRLTWWEKLWNK